MDVQSAVSDAELAELFNHIQSAWQQMGDEEPYWSVLTAKRYAGSTISGKRLDEFYASGNAKIDQIRNTFERNGIDPSGVKTCLEYGCGVGRVTQALCRMFEHVYAVDISAPHIKLGKDYLDSHQNPNVSWIHLSQFDQVPRLPAVDMVFSEIVLQHNPPPIISYILRCLLRLLKPGAVALFQVPTYRRDYRFTLDDYLTNMAPAKKLEMHLLPQKEIFRIFAEEDIAVIEVMEDALAGYAEQYQSCTFFVQKNPIPAPATA
jgi:SAM-dependent methyltransferase